VADRQKPRVPPEVLARLQAAAPDDPAQAARLADTLFADGHFEPAYAVYGAALERETSEARTAWLVFQMANCKKNSDPDLARRLYGQLIAQYPKSRWARPAKIQDKILQWRHVNEPQTVLAEARGAMQATDE
jgi:Tfp pilus assembly protein PilF